MLKTYSPKNGDIISQIPQRIKDFMKMREEVAEEVGDGDYPWCYSVTYPDPSIPTPAVLTWYTDAAYENYLFRLHFSYSEDFENEETFELKELMEYHKYNLIPGARCYWYVENISERYEKSEVAYFDVADEYPRMNYIGFDISNVRDYGGAATVDGRKIKYGLIFRGSEYDGYRKPNSEGCYRFLRELGIKSDIDLRGMYLKNGEYPPMPEGLESVVRYMYPVRAYSDAIDTEEKLRLYSELFLKLCDESIYPAYVHCAQGCDRTGTMFYILSLLLGVREEILPLDYELSSVSLVDWIGKRTYWLTRDVKGIILSYGDKGDDIYTATEKFFERALKLPDAPEKLRKIFLS